MGDAALETDYLWGVACLDIILGKAVKLPECMLVCLSGVFNVENPHHCSTLTHTPKSQAQWHSSVWDRMGLL